MRPVLIYRECPKCKARLALRTQRASGNAFLGCTNYPDCRFTENINETTQRLASRIADLEDEMASGRRVCPCGSGMSFEHCHAKASSSRSSSSFHPDEQLVLSWANLVWPTAVEQLKRARREYNLLAHPDRNPGSIALDSVKRFNNGCDRLLARLG